MQFTYAVTALANTTKDSPMRQKIKLAYGVLRKVQIDFPWGCAGLVGVRIIHYENQLYPTSRKTWFIGNEINITFDTEYPIDKGWNEFKVEIYNEDDFYPHTPVIGFNVLRFVGVAFGASDWVFEGQDA